MYSRDAFSTKMSRCHNIIVYNIKMQTTSMWDISALEEPFGEKYLIYKSNPLRFYRNNYKFIITILKTYIVSEVEIGSFL